MNFGLEKKTCDRIAAVFASYAHLEKVILYGSRAMGTYHRGSDIDLTLVGDKIDLDTANDIALKLDELMLPYSIDLSVFARIQNPELRDHINRRGVVFYAASN